MERDDAASPTRSDDGPLASVGTVVGGLLVGLCSVVAIAVVASWASALAFGTGLAFWPAVAVAVVGILVVVLLAR